MRISPTTVAAAAASSLVTLCVTITVIAVATDAFRRPELSRAQRTEIAELVKEQLRGHDESVDKKSQPQGLSDAQRTEVVRVIKEHFREHPETMQEIIAELIKRRASATAANAPAPANADKSEIIKTNAQALFNSPHQVTLGNPDGNVTLVEFFDYNCGFCKRALADTLTLMKDDPNLKIVLKEFPILGPGSAEAARVAVAVRIQDTTGQKYLAFHQKLLSEPGPANKDTALAAARSAGVDMDRLQNDMTGEEVTQTLAESVKLAQALGINGTPGYVVGDTIVPGAVGAAALKARIQLTRERPGK
ncbi:MAG TPA: DsbA family protein [Stellaceae bacterium]|nr:DsbA family protein [Xanthobacteraceae bacterium]HUK08763.1 DsbA family protein [Stellaceae bacterium]